MLLDRIDELPLRRHEIRGNPAGLLARIVDRIDALKSGGVTAERFRRWSEEQAGGASSERDSAAREREFAEIYELHDAMLRAAGAMDDTDAVLELTRLLGERPALAEAVSERFPHLIVDEVEDACPAERSLIEALAARAETAVLSCDDEQAPRPAAMPASAWARQALGAAEVDAGADLALRRRSARRVACGGGTRRARRRGPPPRRRTADPGPLLVRDERARRGPGRRARHRGRPGRRRGEDGGDLRGGSARRRPRAGDRRRARGAARSLPAHRPRRLLPAPGGPRRDRLASPAGRSHRRRRGGSRPQPSAGGAALGRPRPLHDDRPAPQARHGLRARGLAGEPADPARGARSDPRVPPAPPRGGPGDGRDAGRRLRPAPDRADRLPPPPAVRRPPRGGRAAAQPLAPRRARRGLDAPGADRLEPRLRPLPGGGLRGRGAAARSSEHERADRRRGAR